MEENGYQFIEDLIAMLNSFYGRSLWSKKLKKIKTEKIVAKLKLNQFNDETIWKTYWVIAKNNFEKQNFQLEEFNTLVAK